jgi:DNA-binding IclR family transcriptional regulator
VPPRHHRTVDRTVAIMELASRAGSGVTLSELAARLDAPKSSIQELTNGLLATGYLVERERRFLLGPGAFVLSLHTAGLPLRMVRHEELERAQQRVGLTLFVGVRLGDDQVFVDQAGEDVLMDFVSATHPRRPLLTTATGKIILAYMDSSERNEFLRRMEHEQPAAVKAFIDELAEIRATQLAFNYATTVPDRYTVATPLIDPEDSFLAAICAVGGREIVDSLPAIGERLREAVGAWAFPRRRRRGADSRRGASHEAQI